MSGGEPGRRRVGALALEHVGAVQPRGAHADQHLAAAGLRVGALLDDQRSVLDGYRRPHRAGGMYCRCYGV